ncbi:toxin HicA [Synergistales bacterium]|nr:toxin HicA [Synergistales bacterium]
MTFREADKMVTDDGWYLVSAKGSHHHYKHDTKQGKVSIPKHGGDLTKRVVASIKKQAGL